MHIEECTKDRIKWAVSIISLGILIYIFKTTWLPKLEDALSTTILYRGEMSYGSFDFLETILTNPMEGFYTAYLDYRRVRFQWYRCLAIAICAQLYCYFIYSVLPAIDSDSEENAVIFAVRNVITAGVVNIFILHLSSFIILCIFPYKYPLIIVLLVFFILVVVPLTFILIKLRKKWREADDKRKAVYTALLIWDSLYFLLKLVLYFYGLDYWITIIIALMAIDAFHYYLLHKARYYVGVEESDGLLFQITWILLFCIASVFGVSISLSHGTVITYQVPKAVQLCGKTFVDYIITESGAVLDHKGDMIIPSNVKQMAQTINTIYYLTTDNELYSFSVDEEGAVINHEKIMDDIVFVSGYKKTIAAIDSKGRLWAWGDLIDFVYDKGAEEEPQLISDAFDFRYVDVGKDHIVVIDENDTCWGFGHNYYGQLGNNDKDLLLHGLIRIKDDVKIAKAGNDVTYLLTNQGIVYGCGRNELHQMGTEHNDACTSPVKIPILENIIQIAACSNGCAALDENHNEYIWGSESDYASRKKDDTDYYYPSIYTSGIQYIADHKYQQGKRKDELCVIKDDEKVYSQGSSHVNYQRRIIDENEILKEGFLYSVDQFLTQFFDSFKWANSILNRNYGKDKNNGEDREEYTYAVDEHLHTQDGYTYRLVKDMIYYDDALDTCQDAGGNLMDYQASMKDYLDGESSISFHSHEGSYYARELHQAKYYVCKWNYIPEPTNNTDKSGMLILEYENAARLKEQKNKISKSDWAKSYQEVLNRKVNTEGYKFELKYLDEDQIPELFIWSPDKKAEIYTFYNGAAIKVLEANSDCDIQYFAETYTIDLRQRTEDGTEKDSIYTFEDGTAVLVAELLYIPATVSESGKVEYRTIDEGKLLEPNMLGSSDITYLQTRRKYSHKKEELVSPDDALPLTEANMLIRLSQFL